MIPHKSNEAIIEEKRASARLRELVRQRVLRMQAAMVEDGLDAVIVMRPENVFYFSNFNPIIISHVPYFIITREKGFLLIHSIRRDHAVNEGAAEEIYCYGKWGAVTPTAMNPFDAMKELLGDAPMKLGIEYDYMNLQTVHALKSHLAVQELSDISGKIARMRLIKDEHEIAMCTLSGRFVDLGVETALDALSQGASEAEACTQGQYAMRRFWLETCPQYEVSGFSNSETAAYDTLSMWCMSNERLNYGADCPTAYVPVPGDITMPMCWARIGGYNVENERTVLVGQVEGIRREAYDAMLRAREAVFSLLRPGTVFEDLYLAAMKVFEDAGFGSILPGRCGHGMGLSSHEFPSVTKGNRDALKPGMIFTVEPGLMSTQIGACRHSDTVLITQDGYELLTRYDRGSIRIK